MRCNHLRNTIAMGMRFAFHSFESSGVVKSA
jgi:hypothetical protein